MKIPKNIVAEGLSIMQGECKWNSGVFNARPNGWNLPGSKAITENEQLNVMIKECKKDGDSLKCLPEKRNIPVEFVH